MYIQNSTASLRIFTPIKGLLFQMSCNLLVAMQIPMVLSALTRIIIELEMSFFIVTTVIFLVLSYTLSIASFKLCLYKGTIFVSLVTQNISIFTFSVFFHTFFWWTFSDFIFLWWSNYVYYHNYSFSRLCIIYLLETAFFIFTNSAFVPS